MFNVNNKKAIRNIAKKSFKANKTRNIIAIIAIALTCILFTSVFTIALSLAASIQNVYFRQVGTTHHAGYQNLTLEMAEKVQNDSAVHDISYRIFLGETHNKELSKTRNEISYIDNSYYETSFSTPNIGTIPNAINEICVSNTILEAFGLPLEIGQDISLQFMANGKTYDEIFTVSGIFELDLSSDVGQIYVSREYIESITDIWTGENNEHYMNAISASGSSFKAGSISINFNFNSSHNIREQLDELSNRLGFDMRYINDGVNSGYIAETFDFGNNMTFVCLGILIFISGYLIIHNIFLISVSNDIRFFGLLKTIGTTGKQLKKILYHQAFLLFLIGTPIGLIIGHLIGKALMPILVGTSTLNYFVVSINPMIFIFSALTTLITVFISCIHSAVSISKMSPLDAIRYSETKRKNNKKRSRRITPFSMAITNLGRNKKKTTMVILSLSLSALIFNVTYTYVNGWDLEENLSGFMVSDFLISSSGNININLQTLETSAITSDVVSTFSALEGIEDIGFTYVYNGTHVLTKDAKDKISAALISQKDVTDPVLYEKYTEMLQNNIIDSSIYGVSETLLDKLPTEQLDRNSVANTLKDDMLEKFLTGNYVLRTGYFILEEEYYNVGEMVLLDFGNGNTKEYEVLSLGDIPYSIDQRFSSFFYVQFILPETEFLKQMGEYDALSMTLNVEDEYIEDAESFIEHYTEINKTLDFESRLTYMEEFETMQFTIWAVGITLSVILALIGIMNFINIMITSITERRLELAMLQSLGLTSRQMQEMLISEGLFYGISVIVFLATIGSLITQYAVHMLGISLIASSYSFEILPFVIILALLGIISFLTPLVIYNNVKRKSIVERLREIES